MKQFFSSLLFLVSINVALYAQDAELTGIIRDTETKEPLSGVSVKYEKGKGGVTDASGKYRLLVPAGSYTVTFSFVGYKNKKEDVTLIAGENKVLNIEMVTSAIVVKEVYAVSQYNKNAAQETVSTEVIGAEQIKNTNANDLGEVVNKTPGVLVQDGQITIRGGSSYSYGVGARTAVLSDGLSLQSGDLQEAQTKMASLENVKQVEVIKGASSVVYGSSALNGVVNVVSQWPSDSDPKTSIETNVSVSDRPEKRYQQWWSSPPFGTNINVNHQRRIKNVQLIVAGNLTGIKSYLEENDEFRVRASFRTRYLHPKISGLNFGLNGSVLYERSERFFISQNLDSGALQIAKGSDDRYIKTTVDPFVNYTHTKGHRVSFNWRYMNVYRKANVGDPNAIDHQLIADNQYQYKFKGNMLIFTGGVPFKIGSSSSNLYPGVRSSFAAAVYAQLEFNYKVLSLQGGIRYEAIGIDSVIVKDIPVFRAGLNVQAARGTFFRASWGQGYRVPSIGEKFLSSEFVNGVFIVPNDTLKTERGWSLELGFSQLFKIGKWSGQLEGSLFWQEYKQFIEYQFGLHYNYYGNGTKIYPDSVETGPGRVLGLRAFNIENARIAGYELGISGKGNIGPVGVRILAGYTYTWPGKDERDTSGNRTYSTGEFIKDMFKYSFRKVGADDTSRILYYRIRHLVRADIELTYWKVYVGATFNYGSAPEKIPPLFKTASSVFFNDPNALDRFVAEHKNGDFFMDIRAGFNVNDKVKVGFIVKNVTNRLYALRPGKVEPLRNYTLQFRYIF